jgi:2-polyprenyl-3-methyl-5-hydroxy-6-metoxy-1,4-benzoquinol methylase
MENKYFEEPDSIYYNREKNSLQPFFDQGPNVILDLGCANGRLGRKLKETGKAKELVGVEIFAPAAEEAAKHYDRVFQNDLESILLPYNEYFDYVICGDILEHLRDPWEILRKIHMWLKKDGQLVCSIPNIRFWRVIRDLLFNGKWEYVDSGILDITHLRFFTRSSFIEILKQQRFHVVHQSFVISGKKRSLNKLTLGYLQEFLGSQVVIVAEKE